MRIIAISREFGSGGREFGKRLAEKLCFAYYDAEIIAAIAAKSGLAESYVQEIVEQRHINYYPITYGKTLHGANLMDTNYLKVVQAQTEVIRELAEKRDCVFVGRCADVILKSHNPLNIFVHASMDSKVARCQLKAPVGEDYSERELQRKINEVEKRRSKYYRLFSMEKWGNKENYHLCINTTGKEIKRLVPSLAEYCLAFWDN